MSRPPIIEATDRGLYCAAGDFYVDPWKPVDRAVITHAHSDHARPGSKRYLASDRSAPLLRIRLGDAATIESVDWNEPVTIGDAKVSLHPAGHLLGSAQVRIAVGSEVLVVSGDYKTESDPTCTPFEPIACDTFITECTFGLPIYRWPGSESIVREINEWWAEQQAAGRTCIIYAYALGKAQRVLSMLDAAQGPILVHGAVDRLLPPYREAGIALPETQYADADIAKASRGRAMVIAPPSAAGTPWLRKFGPISTAFASGWMLVRGARRRRSVDRGFVLSDHVDWDGLQHAVELTGARHIGLTHGSVHVMSRWFDEQGYATTIYPTHFEGEQDAD